MLRCLWRGGGGWRGAAVAAARRRGYCAPSRKPELSSVSRLMRMAFGRYLLWTNTVSSGVLMLVGDLLQQEIEYQQNQLPHRYDYGRLWRMFLVALSQGPLHHYYYSWLSKIMPDRRIWTVTKKILLDQFFMSPVCIVTFFYGVSYLEHKPLRDSTAELTDKFIEIYTVDWVVWPPAQFINFYLVAHRFQVLYINSVTTVYNVYLSYIKHRREPLPLALTGGEEKAKKTPKKAHS